jgi:hypothetical protein
MQFICDAPDRKSWFRIETEFEADQESALMDHGVDKHFRRARECAVQTYKPSSTVYFEQNIGLEAHVREEMSVFLTLRDCEGNGLATAMLPPGGKEKAGFRKIIVGHGNSDPFPENAKAIEALGKHFGISVDKESCYPYSSRQTAMTAAE